MNEAVTKGYELWVRVKTSEGRDNAEDMENKLVEKYDYAWNIRKNGEIRTSCLLCLNSLYHKPSKVEAGKSIT